MGVRLAMAISIFLSYALQFYVPMSIAWPKLQARIPKNAQTVAEFAFRTALVILTCEISFRLSMKKLMVQNLLESYPLTFYFF